jgi:hypothetical protein
MREHRGNRFLWPGCRGLLLSFGGTIISCAAACQIPAPDPASNHQLSSETVPHLTQPSPDESGRFPDSTATASGLRCTQSTLSIAHGQWFTQTTERVLTFEHALSSAELQRWQTSNADGSVTVLDTRADGSSVYWLSDVTLLLPSPGTGSCGEIPSHPAQRPTECAHPVPVGTPWQMTIPSDERTPELEAVLHDFDMSPEENQPSPAQCQLLAAAWSRTGPIPTRTELRTRWCVETGPEYLQTRTSIDGVVRLSIQRCRTVAQ